MITQITQIENLLLQERLDFDFKNSLFNFSKDRNNEFLIDHLKSFLENDNIEFRKAALYIILISEIKEKTLYAPMLSSIFLFDEVELRTKYILYMNRLDEKILINFLYTIILTLKDEKLTLFIHIVIAKFTEERITMLIFLLESFQLTNPQFQQIYLYMYNGEQYKTIDHFYDNAPIIKEFTESLKEKDLIKISYKDFENPDSLLRKKLATKNIISYFYNEDEKRYQLWINVSDDKKNEIATLKGINFNALIHFPGSLMLYFQFHTEDSVFPLKIDLYLPNRHDSAFLYRLIKEKNIELIFINNNQLIDKFNFAFNGEIFFKLINQSWLSKRFRDFEWLHIKQYMDKIEAGEFFLIDIPVSIFRKIHFDLSIFKNVINKIEGSNDMSLYFQKFAPVFYTENDLDVLTKEQLEDIVKTYISILDKNFPYLLLFISNLKEDAIKYMSYLLNDDFSKENITQEVIKRLIFIAKYLKLRSIPYYEILEKIALIFKIELPDKFFKKLDEAEEII